MTKSSSTKRLVSAEVKADLEAEWERVFKIVNRKVQDENISDDLVQEAYQKTLARLERTDLEPIRKPVGLLVFIAAKQTDLHFRKKEQRVKRINSAIEPESLSTSDGSQQKSGSDHEQNHKQYLHMLQLAEKNFFDAEIHLLHLRFEEELTFQQIAADVGSPLSTVEYQIKKLLIRLKELEQKDPFPETDKDSK